MLCMYLLLSQVPGTRKVLRVGFHVRILRVPGTCVQVLAFSQVPQYNHTVTVPVPLPCRIDDTGTTVGYLPLLARILAGVQHMDEADEKKKQRMLAILE